MGKFVPIQQEEISQTSKVADSSRKSKKQILVSDEEDSNEVAEVAEEQVLVEEGKRKKQPKYPSTIKRSKGDEVTYVDKVIWNLT